MCGDRIRDRMRKCGSCFRFMENNDDAKAKNFELKNDLGYFGEFSRKPRPGIKCRCCCHPYDMEFTKEQKCCEHHHYRWTWNLSIWWVWHLKYKVSRWFSKYIRVPIGSLRKPVALMWVDYFDGMADRIVPHGEPKCPHCGEMPYSDEQCVFCGQRFLSEGRK